MTTTETKKKGLAGRLIKKLLAPVVQEVIDERAARGIEIHTSGYLAPDYDFRTSKPKCKISSSSCKTN